MKNNDFFLSLSCFFRVTFDVHKMTFNADV